MCDHKKMLSALQTILEDMKAESIVMIPVGHQTSVTDTMVVCTGRSSRHVRAVADDAKTKMKEQGYGVFGDAGLRDGEWALVDFGDVVLHVMQAETRTFYDLESLWNA